MPPLSSEEIQELSYQELRAECARAQLSSRGNTEILRKRLRGWSLAQLLKEETVVEDEDNSDDENQHRNKRHKKSPSDDLVCPITLELTWEPVTAEDGRVYEKEAIEKHIENHRGNGRILRSPVTNELMGPRIYPAPQHKSLIETLVENGQIDGDLVTTWNKKVQQYKEMQELLRRANAGDSVAMEKVAFRYKKGENGFKKDPVIAFSWYQKGHAAGNVKATASLGVAYVKGRGITKCPKKGLMFLSMAAALGSDYASHELGLLLADGKHGVPMDKEEAIRWLRKSLTNCPHSHMNQHGRDGSTAKLEELLAPMEADEEEEEDMQELEA